MAWDLRSALLKKQEVETARLVDFEFRQRARTMRLLAEALGLEPATLVRAVAEKGDQPILEDLAEATGLSPSVIAEHYAASRARARTGLIGELGDPTPHRLA